jgi:23S rRNA pseudouridine1911/1915/1917 synthase
VLATSHWTVASEEDGVRLDVFLARHLSSFSRRERATLIARQQVLLNGRPAVKSATVRANDRVSVRTSFALAPQPDLPVHLVYADDILVVVSKPSGMPSLALRHTDSGTVANFLLAHFPETVTAGSRELEAGLVHRLDTDTSGLLIAARTPFAHESLRRQFHNHQVKKEYIALVEGIVPTAGKIAVPLTATGKRGQHVRLATPPNGQQALTLYTPVDQLPKHTLLRVTLVTGARHQIRVHLATIQHPIVGESRYGGRARQVAQRLCLHAETLVFTHPQTGESLRFTSPVPEDFSLVLQRLREEANGK